MSEVSRLTPVVLTAAGIVLFIAATAAGSNVLYGVADIMIGAALALFAVGDQPATVRSQAAVRGGLALAAAAAVVAGVLTITDQSRTATDVLTWVIVAGVLVAVLGRGLRR